MFLKRHKSTEIDQRSSLHVSSEGGGGPPQKTVRK